MATADRLARAIGRLYASVEAELLTSVADRLGRDLDGADWARRKRDEIGAVRRDAERIIGRLNRSEALTGAVGAAWEQGQRDATADLRALGRRATTGALDAGAFTALAAELAGLILPRHRAVLRDTEDVYREVISRASPASISGVVTRRDAAQRALWDFADRGVSSFTDRSGRRWDLASYAEMATRTTAARAMVDSLTDRLGGEGVRLVQVSDSPNECSLCRPWEGLVLAASGPPGDVQVEHATEDGVMVTVRVAGTLDEARAAGLLHPNCTHSVRAHLPGVTRAPTDTANPRGDADRQRLRALERRVRKWKQREAAALDDTARRRARDGVRAAQADIRAHVAGTSAKRQPHREQITTAR